MVMLSFQELSSFPNPEGVTYNNRGCKPTELLGGLKVGASYIAADRRFRLPLLNPLYVL